MSEQTLVEPSELHSSPSELSIKGSLNLQSEEFEPWKDDFIAARLAELQADTEPSEVNYFTNPVDKFIHPDTEIKPLYIGRGFRLDDEEIYNTFLDTLHDLYARKKYKELPFNLFLLYGLQFGLQNYFGNMKPSKIDEQNREKRLRGSAILSVDDDIPEPPVRSIAENKEEALCAERAAVAHNLLSLAGKESYFCLGKLRLPEGDHGMHAFVIFKNAEGKYMIYDPMNPEFILDNAGNKIVGIVPAIHGGGEEILAGRAIEVEHDQYRVVDRQPRRDKSEPYLYISNHINLEAA